MANFSLRRRAATVTEDATGIVTGTGNAATRRTVKAVATKAAVKAATEKATEKDAAGKAMEKDAATITKNR